MLLVIKKDSFKGMPITDLMKGKKITINGVVEAAYFKDDYIEKLEEKVREYEELKSAANKMIKAAESLLETIK